MMRESWFQIALRRDVVHCSLKVAVVVGTVLVAINQAEAILSGQVTGRLALKIALTYLVPYCVATYGAVHAIRGQ